MNEKAYIKRRDKEDNLYERLQKQSLEMIRQLSGNCWTDYNEHDPGITILDTLNYALLELDHSFGAPFEEYLTDPEKNELYLKKTGLLPPDEIFAPVIVTAKDYESLFMTVENVRNCNLSLNAHHLYTITIDAEEHADQQALKEKIAALYHRHRNLCENLEAIRFGKIPGAPKEDREADESPRYTEIPAKQYYPKKGYTYHTIQNEFPECYGIGERGLPSGAPVGRKVEALHLQGYLLVFDYLMCGITQQAGAIETLLELSDRLPDGFRPEINIPGLNNLLDKEKLNQSSVFDPKEIISRKETFFDHLDVLYGEDTKRYSKDRTRMFRANLIQRFPAFNTLRFRSFDITDKSMKSLPGIKLLINTLLGNDLYVEMSVINNFSRYNLKLITDDKFFDELQGMFSVEFLMDDQAGMWSHRELSGIPLIPQNSNLKKYYRMMNQLNLFRHNILFEGFLKSGMDPANFRCLRLHDESGCLLLYKQPGRKEWINLGFFFDKQKLTEACNCLWDFIRKLNRESFSFYFVEHILLTNDEKKTPEDYNRLTIIIPRWIDNLYDKETYLDIFEERLPAHLDIQYSWLGVEDLKSFEESYFRWRNALANNDPEQINELSKQIREKMK